MTMADQLKRKPGLAGVHGNLMPRQKVPMKKNYSKDATPLSLDREKDKCLTVRME